MRRATIRPPMLYPGPREPRTLPGAGGADPLSPGGTISPKSTCPPLWLTAGSPRFSSKRFLRTVGATGGFLGGPLPVHLPPLGLLHWVLATLGDARTTMVLIIPFWPSQSSVPAPPGLVAGPSSPDRIGAPGTCFFRREAIRRQIRAATFITVSAAYRRLSTRRTYQTLVNRFRQRVSLWRAA